ncbi:hypothetical protein ANGELICA_79 [Mycobacterium phage Angelica]|uniref:Uncharacterized protein n=1 Tax=Mycobacterium phage Angelica TaxID=2902837 RepID=E0YPY4_9CAUD|nr:hypothetical protein ANGELICA_79 [Mycobacterium phage Angelica]ADL71168.1 hypothetical protein ANGELICA_79 [Mycobacterium phage Angelica]
MGHEHEGWQIQPSASGGWYCAACGEAVSGPPVLRTAPFPHYHARRAARVLGVGLAVVEAMAAAGKVRAVRVEDGQGGWVWAVDALRVDELVEANARTGLHPYWACGFAHGCNGCVSEGEGA